MFDFPVGIIFIIGCLIFWVYKSVKDTIRAWRGRGVIYGIKTLLARSQVIVALYFAVYIIYAGALLIIPFRSYFDKIAEHITPTTFNSLIIGGLPFAYVMGLVVLAFATIFIGINPIWKQTDEERKYEKELREADKTKYVARVMKYPRIIKWFLLN